MLKKTRQKKHSILPNIGEYTRKGTLENSVEKSKNIYQGIPVPVSKGKNTDCL